MFQFKNMSFFSKYCSIIVQSIVIFNNNIEVNQVIYAKFLAIYSIGILELPVSMLASKGATNSCPPCSKPL